MTTERKLCWTIIGLQIIIILIKIYLSYKMNLMEERLTQDISEIESIVRSLSNTQ